MSPMTPERPGRLRLLAGMVIANRPWRLVLGMRSALAAVMATSAYLVITSTIWQLASSLSTTKLAVTMVAAVIMMVVWIIGAPPPLAEPGRAGRGLGPGPVERVHRPDPAGRGRDDGGGCVRLQHRGDGVLPRAPGLLQRRRHVAGIRRPRAAGVAGHGLRDGRGSGRLGARQRCRGGGCCLRRRGASRGVTREIVIRLMGPRRGGGRRRATPVPG